MTVLSRVNQFTKTIKNMGRFRQIIGVFAKHGFADFLKRSQLNRFIPSGVYHKMNPNAELTTPVRLRLAFEELGPTFIKLGQMLATRGDLLPSDLVDEMKKLQDNAPPFPYEEVPKMIEAELKGPLTSYFSSIDERPIAAASISQVHRARTLDGDDVVIKVQRPGIQKEVKTDIELLTFFAGWFEETIPEIRSFSPKTVIKEFSRSLREELDFRIEANNIRRISQNMRDFSYLRIPRVYSALSSGRVLTLELIRGVRIDEIGTLKSHGIDLKKTIQKGMDAFLHQVLVDGIFHCDLHAGNVLILENGDIGLVDFGSVGRLSQRVRDQLIHLFLALFSENYESLAYAYMELAPSNATQTDVEKFQKDLVDTLSPYFGMSIKDLDTGKVLMESSAVAVRHKLELPSDLILLFRALITAQGMAKALDPEFDIVQSSNRHIKTVIKVRYSKERLIGDAVLLARNSFDLIQMLPQQMRLFIRRLYLNQVGFQHNFPQLAKALHIHHGHYLHRTYIMAGCLFAFIGQMKLESTQPPVIFHLSLFVWLPWIVSIGFFILAVLQWIGIRLSGKP